MENALKFLSIMRHKHKEVYIVGGAVRDMIMGIEPNDVDFCTDLTPEEIKKLLMQMGIPKRDIDMKDSRVGVVVVNYKGEKYEVTTFRKEVYESGSRKPKVEFTRDIMEDLYRRDFNINSVAWQPGRFIDPTRSVQGGEFTREIKPMKPFPVLFEEDPLRILRYIRFYLKYSRDYDYEPVYLKPYIPKLHRLSFETYRKEIERGMLVHPNAHFDYYIFGAFSVIPYVIESGGVPSVSFTGSSSVEIWALIMNTYVSRSHYSQEENDIIIEKSLRMMNFSRQEIEDIMSLC